MPERIIVIDLETTGLYPERGARILEIAAVPIVTDEVRRGEAFHRLVNPGRPIPPEITLINHITDSMVRDADPIDIVLPEFFTYIGSYPLVAHNAPFDIGFLRFFSSSLGYGPIGNRVVDTLEMSKELFPEQKSHSLDALLQRLGIPFTGENRHRSIEDARLTALCYLSLKRLL